MAVQLGVQESATERWGLGRSLTVAGVAVIALFMSAVGGLFWWELEGTWNSTPVSRISEVGEDLKHALSVQCHTGEIRASAMESDAMIVVSAEISGGERTEDCAGGVLVRLSEPIGDRLVIDWATGKAVPTSD